MTDDDRGGPDSRPRHRHGALWKVLSAIGTFPVGVAAAIAVGYLRDRHHGHQAWGEWDRLWRKRGLAIALVIWSVPGLLIIASVLSGLSTL